MTAAITNVACAVEAYPFEGGSYVLQGEVLLRVTTVKTMENPEGTVQAVLAPGGPAGTDDPITWSKILTPMSHILVGMTRGNRSALVLNGVITNPVEQQDWGSGGQQGSRVMRTQALNGSDFGWFFTSFNFFALSFQGLMAGTPIGTALDLLPAQFSAILSKGLKNTTPAAMGRTWYEQIMVGQNGVLAKTFVPYQNNSRVYLSSAIGVQLQNYPNTQIPFTDYFLVNEGSWAEKFKGIFPFPWYDFFIVTAPSGSYLANGTPAGGAIIQAGTQFSMQSMPWVPAAGPIMIARVNPTPKFSAPSNGGPIPNGLDVAAWQALPVYDFTQENYGFNSIDINFSANSARNFYIIDPVIFQSLYGGSNSSPLPYPFLFISAGDPASIQRYGFRPQIGSLHWLNDPEGVAQQNSDNVTQTFLNLTAVLASWYHPVPLMGFGNAVIPLTPDVPVGTRFRCAPYKDGIPWEFFIEAVKHDYTFGGECTTTLTLTRGLPVSVYEDPNGKLFNVFVGNAMKQNGVYTIGLPAGTGPCLQFATTPQEAQNLNQLMYTGQTTPQNSGNKPVGQ